MKPINRSSFEPEVGMALATKNGQRTGNAFIVSKESVPEGREDVAVFYNIITDYGNRLSLLPSDINDMFDVADWWIQQGTFMEIDHPNAFNHRCPKQRIQRQIELLTEALKDLEESE
jgi:hypothetical protein